MVTNIYDQSILTSVKKALGINEDDSSFDPDILLHVNGSLGDINQVGVGNPLMVQEGETWNDFLPIQQSQRELIGFVIQYVSIKTKIMFDPPAPSTLTVMDSTAKEILWRIEFGRRDKEEFYNESAPVG